MTLKEACETALAIEADGHMLPIEIKFASWFPIGYGAPYAVRCIERSDTPSRGTTLELVDRPADVRAALDQHFSYFAGLRETREWERP